jgi:diguanylate cyclase (GGDEF)-like protein/PAS domain S-box-containing protein
MNIEQGDGEKPYWERLHLPDLTLRNKIAISALIGIVYLFLLYFLISSIGKSVVSFTVIPFIGFALLFGMVGSILANLGSILLLLMVMYLNFGVNAFNQFNIFDIIIITVLGIVAALISKQKEVIQKLIGQIYYQRSKEYELIDSRDGYRDFIYRIPVGLYRTTPEGETLKASPALVEILGFPDFDTLSQVNISEELYVDPKDRIAEHKLLQEEGIVRDYEMRLYRRNGKKIWVRDNVRAIKDENHQIVFYEGSLEDITERKEMELAEQRQRVLAEALRDTAAALSSTLHFDEVLDRILTNMEHVVPHDAANIMLLENDFARIERSKGYIYDWEEVARQTTRFPIDNIPTLKRMAETGLPLAIPETKDSPLWVDLPHSEWMRSYAGAPIIVKGKMIGFLNLNSSTPGFFTQTKAEWLQAFAHQAAVAIENARMFGEIHEHARQSALLKELTQTTIVVPDLGEMLQNLADRIGELISADGAFITLWDKHNNATIPGAAYGPLRESYSTLQLDPEKTTITSSVLKAGKPLVLNDFNDSTIQINKSSDQCPAQSILGLPLIADRQKLGAVLIAFEEPHEFTEDEISLSEQAARIIALAIYKAKLFDAEKERTEELSRANRIITALGNVATQVEATIDLDKMVTVLGDGLNSLGLPSIVMLQSADGKRVTIQELTVRGPKELTIEKSLELLLHEQQVSPSGFPYYDEVIKQKHILFLNNPQDLASSIIPEKSKQGSTKSKQLNGEDTENNGFLLPLLSGKKVMGCLLLWGAELRQEDMPAFSLFASQVAVAFENARLVAKISQLAITDELTDLYNRRGLYEIGRLEIERTHRYGMPLAAIVIDIDHFKRVNDRFSHAVGDRVLRNFAKCVKDNTRELDIVGRIGGEEFVVLLPGSNQGSAQETADRLQGIIANLVTSVEDGEIKITVSQGVAVMESNMKDLNDLIQAADRALYKAKEAGRNRVVSSTNS